MKDKRIYGMFGPKIKAMRLEQGKPTLRMDKVNQLLDLFNYELTATPKQ